MHDKVAEILTKAQKIVVIQADNPDADSLASTLALEQILHDLNKEPHLYCAVDMPEYLKYLAGWDRVNNTMPTQFDLSIIVDTSSILLLDKLVNSPMRGWVASRPSLVLDHHKGSPNDIPFATVTVNDPKYVSTGELIYALAKELSWPLNLSALEFITTTILADSLGLTSDSTTSDTYRAMAELVEGGVSRPKLEEQRRQYSKMPPSIFKYKAVLIERTELLASGRLALVIIPQVEINQFSPLYNPNALIQNDQLQTAGVLVSIAIKTYDNHLTAGIRCNVGAPIAAKLAKAYGGGGHDLAAGFKLAELPDINQLKKDLNVKVAELLDETL